MTDHLTRLERESIREFIMQAARAGYFDRRVLDYGCGFQPYRKIVEHRGGNYTAYDRGFLPSNQSGDVGPDDPDWPREWDTVLCTQVIQFVTDPELFLRQTHDYLVEGGHLVMTYPTNWPEVEETDLWRFPKSGMEMLLERAGYTVVMHERRESIFDLGYEWAFGYGVVARA